MSSRDRRSSRRILFAAPPDAGVLEALDAQGGLETESGPALDHAALVEAAPSAEILVTRSFQRVDRAVLEAGRRGRLRALVQSTSGRDNVDERAAAELGVVLDFPEPGNAIAVAELTLLSLLAMWRRGPARWRATAAGAWPNRDLVDDRELCGKRLGLVGLGRVGSRVAQRAIAFEMEVLAYDPYLERARFAACGARRVGALDELLSSVDALSLHCPLTDETRGMIGARALERLRPGALLVNTARGGIVDEVALTRRLDEGRIAGAALDVFDEEPPPPGGLASHPRVLATPHIGGHTLESHRARARHLIEALLEMVRRLDAAGESP